MLEAHASIRAAVSDPGGRGVPRVYILFYSIDSLDVDPTDLLELSSFEKPKPPILALKLTDLDSFFILDSTFLSNDASATNFDPILRLSIA